MCIRDSITIAPQDDGSTHVIFAMNSWGADVTCRYWPVENPGRSDPWRYELAAINGPAETWPHPTERGCKIAIIRHLIRTGLIEIPEDNGHLDDRNKIELAAIHSARSNPGPRPVVGDFVIMPKARLSGAVMPPATGCRRPKAAVSTSCAAGPPAIPAV